MVGSNSGCHLSVLKMTQRVNQKLSSPVETFCQHGWLPQHCGSVIRTDSRMNKTYCYSTCTLTMAFLLKHVAPLKLWVVRIVFCPTFPHLFFPHPHVLTHSVPLSLPCLWCSLSLFHVVHLVLFVSLLDLSVNLLFHWVIQWTSSCSSPPQPKATAGVSKICSLSVGKCLQQKLMWLRVFIPSCERH